LKTGVFKPVFYDQLVPFAWLIKEYYVLYVKGEVKEGRLFNIDRGMAYRIVREVTGNYLNWFRAQGKQFYSNFIFDRSAWQIAQFVNDTDPKTEMDYTKFDWTVHLVDRTKAMDFGWIEPAVEQIKQRIEVTLK
jgi:hypothetical protein